MSDAPPGAPPGNSEPEPLPEASSGAGPQQTSGQPSLARLLEKLPYPVSYIDADLVYRQCNAAAAATVGRTPDQIVGRTVASVVGADSEVLALLRRVLESGEPYSGALAFTPAGSARTSHYRVSYVPDTDGDGRTVGVLTNVIDVTDLRESEERFRTIVESMTEGVALHELVYEGGHAVDYRILEVNRAFEAQTGLSAATAEGRLASELYGTGEAPYLAEYAAVAESGQAISFETYFAPMERHFRVAVTCPAPGRFATIFEDVTEHKRAEEALKRQAELLDLSYDAMIVWQPGGTIESWNCGAEELYGFSKAEALGRVSHDLLSTIHERPWPQIEEILREQGSWEGEVRHRAKDGREIIVSTRHQLIRGGDGVERVLETNRDIAERIAAEEALRTSRVRLSSALESMSDAVFISDLDGNFIEFNEAFATFHKFATKHDCAKTLAEYPDFLEVCWPDGTPAPLEQWAVPRALRGETVANAEYHLRRKDTGERWIGSYNFAPVRNEQGVIVGSVVTGRDITAVKQAEEALRESEQRFHLALHNAPVSVAIEDRELRYVWAHNQRSAQPDEITGKLDEEIFTPEEAAKLTALKRQVLDEGVKVREQIWLDRPTGRMFLDVTYEPIRDQSGEVTGIGMTTVDLTQMKLVEEELRRSREDLDRAQAVGQIGSWRLDTRENVLTWSDENHRIFGLPIGTPLSYETFLSVVHPDDRAFVDAKWQAGLRGEPYDVEHRLLVEGQVKWVREKAFLEYDEAGELLGGFGITQDITELMLAEQALRESEAERAAQQERARLARDLHDSVTQALFAAALKAEALTLADDSPSDGTAQVAEEVRRLSRGALAQMRTLLLELRGESLEEVPIAQLLRHLVEAAEGRASIDVRLTVHGDEQVPPALHVAVYRITQEALGNVTRHAGASKAWVDLDVDAEGVHLVVGDDGCGFDPSDFDPTHMGLRSMRERAAEAGAQLDIVTELGGGTT